MWTDPAALTFANGAKVGATILNREARDNLRFLHNPPSATATHDSDQANSSDDYIVMNFGRALRDTAGIHGGAGELGPYPASVHMQAVIAGLWLHSAYLTFGATANGYRAMLRGSVDNGVLTLDSKRIRSSGPDTTNATVTSLPFACQVNLAINTTAIIVMVSSVPAPVESRPGIRQPLHGLHWLGGT